MQCAEGGDGCRRGHPSGQQGRAARRPQNGGDDRCIQRVDQEDADALLVKCADSLGVNGGCGRIDRRVSRSRHLIQR